MKYPRYIMKLLSTAILLTATVLSPTTSVGQSPTQDSGQVRPGQSLTRSPVYPLVSMVREYLALIEQGNIESAAQFWAPSAQTRANRLGISYQDILIKADLNSPAIKSRLLNPTISVKKASVLDDGYYRITTLAENHGSSVGYVYFAVDQGGYYWLTFAQDYHTRKWREKESRYFRFHINPYRSRYLNRFAIESLDNFVDSVAQVLGIPRRQRELLRREKIDYYLCEDEDEVKEITGVSVRGLHDLASDALITSAFPHYHEVAHLLINFRLQELPLTTLPFLQEGLATYLGGRANRSPASLLTMSAYLFRMEVVSIDSLLELMAFHGDNDASISYSAAALFINALSERYGFDRTFDVYRDLSGNLFQSAGYDSERIKERLEERLGTTWAGLIEHFQEDFVSGAFSEGANYPKITGEDYIKWSKLTKGRSRVVSLPGAEVVIDGGRLYVLGRPNSSGELRGTLLLGAKRETELLASELFEEQFADRPFPARRFGIRFDQFEAGLYDYGTSTLVAKFISVFTPDVPYLNSADTTVFFSLPLALIAEEKKPLKDPIYLEQ